MIWATALKELLMEDAEYHGEDYVITINTHMLKKTQEKMNKSQRDF